ncbi:MAG: segregation/condensation protein A [Oligoflexales bacterium]|nr:segregation/condensation protein A [Oligoflexales bacterium]
MDLLLHLVRVNEIDIFNIDIFLLSNQYIEYLRLLKFDDLSDASEFLEMAATLLEIKSRMLLPREEKIEGEDVLEDDDPRRSLQERLILHEQFQKAAETLALSENYGIANFTNNEWRRLEPFYEHIEAPLVGDSASMLILYEQMLVQLSERKSGPKVVPSTHKVTVEQKIDEISKLLKTVRFALFQGYYSQFNSRYELIVYILAVLELTRWGKMKIYQQEINGPIWICSPDFNESYLPISQ